MPMKLSQKTLAFMQRYSDALAGMKPVTFQRHKVRAAKGVKAAAARAATLRKMKESRNYDKQYDRFWGI